MKTIEYFMAPQSPYAYLGHARFAQIAQARGARIEIKPFDLGGRVFPISGGIPVGQRAPQRQAYRLVELTRWAKHHQIPINLKPKFFPVDGEAASLLIIAADKRVGPQMGMAVAHGILRAVWAEERNIADRDTLADIVNAAGANGQQLLSELEVMRVHYDAYTQQAIDKQVFGVPWFVYNNEPFWGQDRLEFLDRALA